MDRHRAIVAPEVREGDRGVPRRTSAAPAWRAGSSRRAATSSASTCSTAARKHVVRLAKDAGVELTPAGSTYPYGKDPRDRNIRIAPTFPDLATIGPAAEGRGAERAGGDDGRAAGATAGMTNEHSPIAARVAVAPAPSPRAVSLSTRAEQMFPTLTPAQIERIAAHGRRRTVRPARCSSSPTSRRRPSSWSPPGRSRSYATEWRGGARRRARAGPVHRRGQHALGPARRWSACAWREPGEVDRARSRAPAGAGADRRRARARS